MEGLYQFTSEFLCMSELLSLSFFYFLQNCLVDPPPPTPFPSAGLYLTYFDLFHVRFAIFPVIGVLLRTDSFTLLLLLHPASHPPPPPPFSSGQHLCLHMRSWPCSSPAVRSRTWAGIGGPTARLPPTSGGLG